MSVSSLRLVLRMSVFVLLCSLCAGQAHAAAKMNLKVGVKGDVLTCSASLPEAPQGMSRALSDGSEISVEWKISVAIERKYWLNNTVASVVVNRHVVADLVSRSWQLEDMTSGISRRVFSIDEAIRFLTALPDFPVVDRSLLTSGQHYVLDVTVSEWEGDKQGNLWTKWFGPKSGSATTEFVMP